MKEAMTALQINTLSAEGILLSNLYRLARTRVKTLTKNEAAKWVGGRRRLEKLVAENKIRQAKPGNKQNSSWRCDAEDVLRHAVMPRT